MELITSLVPDLPIHAGRESFGINEGLFITGDGLRGGSIDAQAVLHDAIAWKIPSNRLFIRQSKRGDAELRIVDCFND